MFEWAKDAFLTVGGGRGFVIERGHRRYVITAAHCLLKGDSDRLPPCIGAAFPGEKTYRRLLGRLGKEPNVSAECVFADPVADIAVLGTPDGQVYYEDADAYDELVDAATPLPIREVADGAPGFMLSLDGDWFRCRVKHLALDWRDAPLWLEDIAQPIEGGMSGSPIISETGEAVGIVCLGGEGPSSIHGPNPRLTQHLPGWLVR